MTETQMLIWLENASCHTMTKAIRRKTKKLYQRLWTLYGRDPQLAVADLYPPMDNDHDDEWNRRMRAGVATAAQRLTETYK